MRIGTFLFALSLTLATPARTFAQAPPSPLLDADEAFRKGREHMNQGNYRKALYFLRESHRTAPGRGKLTNIAICEARLGLVGSATRHIRELLQQLPPGDERVAMLSKEAMDLAPRVPYLRIGWAAPVPPGTTVTLDGEAVPAESMGKDIPVD